MNDLKKIHSQVLLLIFICFIFNINPAFASSDLIATLPNDFNLVQWPDNCLSELEKEKVIFETCAIRPHKGKKFVFKYKENKIVLSEESILKIGKNSLTLIKGQFLVLNKDQDFDIKSKNLRIEELQGPAFLSIETQYTEAHALTEPLLLSLLNDTENLMELKPGTYMSVNGVSKNGWNKEIPKMSPYKIMLKNLARLYPFDSMDFSEFINVYKHNWKLSLNKLSEDYKTLVETEIELEKEKEKRRKIASEKRKEEEKAVKEFFMKKNFIFF